MAGHILATRNLFDNSSFNWVFLLWYLVCGILALLFLFYFNRLVASITSFFIRTYTWHYYRAHVDIQALQFSLLAGRLFLKGVHYHGQNQTIIIQDGYITWRYWLRRTEDLDFKPHKGVNSRDAYSPGEERKTAKDSNEAESRGRANRRELPSRVLIKARGIQWFIYNRSPAYDAILERLNEGQAYGGRETPVHGRRDSFCEGTTYASEPSSAKGFHEVEQKQDDDKTSSRLGEKDDSSTNTKESAEKTAQENDDAEASLPSILGILPIKIECTKGAIVMGNQNTRSILTATFNGASGTITAQGARSIDQYRQSIDFAFTHPIIQFKHNREYKHSIVEEGENLSMKVDAGPQKRLYWYQRLKLLNHVWEALDWAQSFMPHPKGSGSVESLSHHRFTSTGHPEMRTNEAGVYGPKRWLGLTRYLDDEDATIEQERWKAIEYAQFPTIVDSPSIAINFYWDVPGVVRPSLDGSRHVPAQYKSDINGDVPPDWGIDLRIRGGTVNYGPWADRQRADLQAVFFPTLYKDTLPGVILSPGQSRVSTELKIIIDVEERTTLRVPTREDSKDWRWKSRVAPSTKEKTKDKKGKTQTKGKKAQGVDSSPESRPFGWLDVEIFSNSTVSFTMDLVAKSRGYKNRINLDLKGIEVSSSVNHELLLKSQSQSISCDLDYPLEWNALRRWHIDIRDESIELYMLRDHIFLMTDLVNDWGSGPPADFHTFVPFEYTLDLRFRNFKLYVNANDSNIIDNPADVDDNTFIVIWGQELIADLTIPMRNFQPAKNKVSFDIEARDGGFELLTPLWNTQHTFLPSPHVAGLQDLRIDGSYNYHTSTSPSLTDILLLDMHALSLKAELYGFLIRYMMKIKDNYFGDDIHFRTVQEYQELVTKGSDATSKSEQRSRPSNDLDVILTITVSDSCAQLPSQLYSASDSITLDISSIEVDLRVTNYYMDLALTSSPISISRASHVNTSTISGGKQSGTQVVIDGLEIGGHRLFGLPPSEPTYVCNWDFDVGKIEGDCSIHFLHNLTQAIQCFGLTFPDAENALPPLNPPVIHDVTFLRARIQPSTIGLRIEQAVLLLQTQEMNIKFGDWAGLRFSDHISVHVPDLTVSLMDTTDATFTKTMQSGCGETHAFITTTIDLHTVSRKPNFEEDRQLQQDHIALHDMRTQRTPWLLLPSTYLHHPVSTPSAKVRPPAMCFPLIPAPMAANDASVSGATLLSTASTISAQSRRGPHRKSSFLSTTSVKTEGLRQAVVASSDRPAIGQGSTSFRSTSQKPLAPISGKYTSTSTASLGVNTAESNKPDTVLQRGSSYLGFAFSSPYKSPTFPVLEVIPDIRHVPQLPKDLRSDVLDDEIIQSDDLNPGIQQGTSQSSLLINLRQGVRLYCSPRALFLATKLQEGFQAREPETLLDSLQIDAMKQVLGIDAKRAKGSRSLSLRLHTPFIGLNFINAQVNKPGILNHQERYELSLMNLTVNMRFSDLVSHDASEEANYPISAHVAFDQLECSARELMEGHKSDQAVVGLSLLQPVFWINKAEVLSANLQFSDLEIVSASRKVDHVSSLVRQTLVLVENLAGRFSRNANSQTSRLGLLVLLLTKEGDNIPDPPFLSGASFILRSAVNHLRSSDSWKMMSRLRHVLQNLPRQMNESIREKCGERFVSCPHDGSAYVIKTFDHWRTWDLAHVRSSILMQKAFGDLLLSPAQQMNVEMPSNISLRAGRIRLLVDPGPSQNEVVVSKSVVNVSLYQRREASGVTFESDRSGTRDSNIEAYFVQIALRLNWGLCELVEGIVRTVKDIPIEQPQHLHDQANARLSTLSKPRTNWHVVLCMETGILNVDTLALKVVSLCQGLQSSLMFLAKDNVNMRGLKSVAISASAATSEVRSHANVLTLYKLQRPSVVGSKDGSGNDRFEKPWRFVGSGKEVSFQVLASILEISEVADSLVRNELTLIHSWMQSLGSQGPLQKASSDALAATRPRLPKAHVTLFLDAYFVSVAILDTLSYQIHGTGGRTSIKSSLRGESRVDIDIDIRDHSHVFKGGVKQDAVELSSLHIPPISGRLSLDLVPQQKSIALRALAEPIVFDASAIHSLVNAINRPEIVDLGRRSGDDIASIQNHIEELFGGGKGESMKAKKPPTLPQPVLYDAYLTLAGFAIHASTPDSSSNDYAAELEFNMGRIQFKAANNEFGKLETVREPEVEARLDAIKLRLMRSNERESIICGDIAVAIMLRRTSKINERGKLVPSYQIGITNLEVFIFTETASVIVAIAGHLQDTLKTIAISDEVKNLGKLGYARLRNESTQPTRKEAKQPLRDPISEALLSAMYSLEMTNIRVTWKVGSSVPMTPTREPEDLMLSLSKIDLATKKENTARLSIQNFQIQMQSQTAAPNARSANSALLPEVIFNAAYFSTSQDRRFAFQAKGKALDLRLTSRFILPASDLRRSIAVATEQVRVATESWYASPSATKSGKRMNPLGSKRLGSVLVDADFAGAAVYIQGRSTLKTSTAALNAHHGGRLPQHGRYNQFTPEDANSSTTLRAPGFAFKAEYRKTDVVEPSLNAELRVDASSNILYPTVVPLVLEISSSIKEIVGETDQPQDKPRPRRESKLRQARFSEADALKDTDPVAIFGNVSLNLGLRIRRQEFSLSCQPIARVAATACFDDIYVTVNTVRSEQHGKFFSISAAVSRLHASVQHVYSRESTAGFNVDSMVLSLMNSKHVSNMNGISAILKVSPTKLQINAKQSQDFLLFREIWIPKEIRHSTSVPEIIPTAEPQAFIVQRYQQVAAAGAFPWNAAISVDELDVQLDLGQSLGKSTFTIMHFWVSSRKSSDWEQNLCLGFEKVSVNGIGRMSGCVDMHDFKIRTSIQWPLVEDAHNQTPLVQASMGLGQLKARLGFEYQPFIIAHVTNCEFLMYNVRDAKRSARDRLVGMLDANQVQVFLTTTSASQAIALYQAVQRLIQEKQSAYETSLRDIEKYLRRKSSINPFALGPANPKQQTDPDIESAANALKLQTDVVVTLKTVNLGAFPSMFSDNQIFKLEALDASARFAVVLEKEKIHSTLGLTLGQLRIALSGVARTSVPRTLGEISVMDVVDAAKDSRGGTILQVPRLVATMQTWQHPNSTAIDYIFKSSFQGKVDVGWNYSRISYIRGMYNNHERALAQRLGKPLPQSAVQITGLEDGGRVLKTNGGEQEKITAVVNVPQSKYQYTALQPPIIETPQLRDMGEATPPLEWIGLHRERLPNLTHQIVIVTLLQLAAEVDGAYTKILGSS